MSWASVPIIKTQLTKQNKRQRALDIRRLCRSTSELLTNTTTPTELIITCRGWQSRFHGFEIRSHTFATRELRRLQMDVTVYPNVELSSHSH